MSASQIRPDEGEHTTYAYGRIDARELTATLAQVLDRWPCAGIAIAVITEGGLTGFHGHGLADVGAKTPITEETVFRIGSLTKTFTGVALMQLWEQGLVDLDAPANDYLRTFRLVPAKPNLSPPTVRHLLTHTARVGYWRRLSDLLQPGVGSGDRARPSGAPPPCAVLPPGPACGSGARDEVGVQQPRIRRARADGRGRDRPAVGSLPPRPHLRPPGHGAHRPHPIRTGPTQPGHRIRAALPRSQEGGRPRSPDGGLGRDVLHHCGHRSVRRGPAEDRRQGARLGAEARDRDGHVPTTLSTGSTCAGHGFGVRARRGGGSEGCWQDWRPVWLPFGDGLCSREGDRGRRLQQHRRPRWSRRDRAAREHAPSSPARPLR